MGFPVPGKVDFVPVLLQIVPEVEGPRCMPEPFPADNKKDFHNRSASMVCSLLPYRKAVLPLSVGYGCLCCGFSGGFRDEENHARGKDGTDRPDDGRIDIDMLTRPPQTPPGIRSFPERYDRSMYTKWQYKDKEFALS
jgi:hypothetical protein